LAALRSGVLHDQSFAIPLPIHPLQATRVAADLRQFELTGAL
jgi:hypothetical protein